jgi:hypothetical protein
MRGHVLVSSSPWYAVTDAAGKAVVDNLPEGQAEMKLWHPDQLIDQPPVRVQVGAASPIEGKLNFTPRVRPAPRSGTTASGPTSNYR